MAVTKRVVPVEEIDELTTGVTEDVDIDIDAEVPAELDFLDADDGARFTLKLSESFTFAGRNHIVVFDGEATLREGEHFALMAQRLADLVLYGLSASKDMFIAQKRAEREGGVA